MKKRIFTITVCLTIIAVTICSLAACSLFRHDEPARPPYYVDIDQAEDLNVANMVAHNNLLSCVRVFTEIKTTGKAYIASGFFVTEDGYIVTNRHCVVRFASTGNDVPESPDEKPMKATYQIATAENYYYRAQLVDYSLDTDIAVLKISDTSIIGASITGAPTSFYPVTFESKDSLFYGDKLYTIGNPDNIGLVLLHLSVASPAMQLAVGDKYKGIIVDGNINHGNSGGPLINPNSRVVGIICSRVGTDDSYTYGLGCAMPATAITDFLTSINVPFADYDPDSAAEK